jgi:hypothetical protein
MKHYIIFFRIISFCFLVRNSFAQDNTGRAISTFWRQGLPEPLNSFYTVVQLGDRYEMKFTLIAQRKTGEQVSLENKLVYNLPLL